jgi:hypothetical protein
MIAEKIKSSFGFSTDAVRCTLSLVNRQFSLPIEFQRFVDEVASWQQSDDVCRAKFRLLPRQQKATAFGRDVAPHGRELGAPGLPVGLHRSDE